MSIWGILGVLFLIIQFVYEQYNKKTSEIENEEVEEEVLQSSGENVESISLEQAPIVERQRRTIQDKESEIIGNNKLTKEQFVKDYIMAEILSKPISKK